MITKENNLETDNYIILEKTEEDIQDEEETKENNLETKVWPTILINEKTEEEIQDEEESK